MFLFRKGSLPVLIALTVQNTSLVICLKLTFKGDDASYAPSTVVLLVEVFKLCLCSCVVVIERASQGLSEVVTQIANQGSLFVPSMLYVVQSHLLFYGAERLPSLTYVLCSQLKILTTAVMSRALLGTLLSPSQYASLAVLMLGIVIVQLQGKADSSHVEVDAASRMLGVTAVVLAAWTSGTAGVFLEKIFKASCMDGPVLHTIWTRNVQLSLVSIPFAGCGVLLQSSEQTFSGRFFEGYNATVWLVIILQAAGGIIVSLVMKHANSILKNMAVAISICCCATYSVITGELQLSSSLIFGICCVCASVFGYSHFQFTLPRPGKQNVITAGDTV